MVGIIHLTAEHKENPLNIGVHHPRLGWSFGPAIKQGVYQEAYQIRVSDNLESLTQGIGNVWDSGMVLSRQNSEIPYQGKELLSCKRYYWNVTVTINGKTVEAVQPAWWETGLLKESDWQASWIGVNPDELKTWESAPGYTSHKPLPLFRRNVVFGTNIISARAYISAPGHFELRINGHKAGNHVLEPSWSHYNKTCYYAVHDVTSLVTGDTNTIGVMLGNGFYNIQEETGRYLKQGTQRNAAVRTVIQGDPAFIMQLKVEYQDGSVQWVNTDESWSVSPGPIVYSCMYGGEDYDARREQQGWDTPVFKDHQMWTSASVVDGPGGQLRAEICQPNLIQGTFKALSWVRMEPGVYVADFGQNFSGWFDMDVSGGSDGSSIKVIPAELLDDQGRVRQELQQKDEAWNYCMYIKGTSGMESWHPQFTYTGYRYVQVEGAIPRDMLEVGSEWERQLPVLERLEGQLIYPDAETIGMFECSNPLWNSIHKIINWAMLSNIKSSFTDCPHREKLGWLEEVHLMGPSVLYNYDVLPLFRKAVEDMSESQLPSGMVPSISPEYAVFDIEQDEGFRDSPEWGGAYVIVPWYLYHWSGDIEVLRNHYEGMSAYADYLFSKSTDGGLITHGLGDWADVGPNPPHAQNTPIPITATGYYYYVLTILEAVSRLLGEQEKAQYYQQQAEHVNEVFHRHLFDEEARRYGSGSQTSQAAPVALGMVKPEHLNEVVDSIARDVEAHNFHTTSGDVGHRLVLQALAEHGHSEWIARMLNTTDDPGYGYQIVHGATSLTEHWDGPTSGKSQNHFMLGHAEEWLYRHLCGIQRDYDGKLPQGVDLRIRPFIPEGIEWAKASHRLPQGEVSVSWKRHGEKGLSLELILPTNVTAEVCIPCDPRFAVSEQGREIELAGMGWSEGYFVMITGSGIYHFESVIS